MNGNEWKREMAGWSFTFIVGKIKPAQSAPLTALITQCFISFFCPLLHLLCVFRLRERWLWAHRHQNKNCSRVNVVRNFFVFDTNQTQSHDYKILKWASMCLSVSRPAKASVCDAATHFLSIPYIFAFGVSYNREKQIVSAIFLLFSSENAKCVLGNTTGSNKVCNRIDGAQHFPMIHNELQ